MQAKHHCSCGKVAKLTQQQEHTWTWCLEVDFFSWNLTDENSGGSEERRKWVIPIGFFGSSPKYVEKSLEPGEVFHVTNWLIQRVFVAQFEDVCCSVKENC